MKGSIVLCCLSAIACGSVSPEGVSENSAAVHTGVAVILQPRAGVLYSGWTKFPSNSSTADILKDYNDANPNASYIYAPPGGPIGDGLVLLTAPSQTTCNSIISIQSVTAQFRLHTGSANESFMVSTYDPLTGDEGDIPCGNMSPWRPVGYQFDCGSNVNPFTRAAWTKQNIGCNIVTGGLEWEWSGAATAGIVWESLQIKATVTTL